MKRKPSLPRSRAERLRADAEAQAARAPVATVPERPSAEYVHELQVHQIELELQNEALRDAQQALGAARDRYVDLYDFAPVGYATLGADSLIAEANLTCAALLGVKRARLLGSPFARYVAPADADRWHRYALALIREGQAARVDLLLLGEDGRRVHAQLDGLRVAVQGAEPMLRITFTDVTERKRSEAELRLAAVSFETQEGIMITDAKGVIERVNNAFTQITGYSAAEAVGRPARLLYSGRHDADFYATMWQRLRRTGAWQGEIWNRRKNGELYPEWLSITSVKDDDPAVTHYVGTMMDITQRKSGEEEIAQLSELAFHDPLTGLANRRLMEDHLRYSLAISSRTKRMGALMFIDLDNFKKVNDIFGHANGDLLLQQVARRLTASVRAYDTVARLSGDEFVVLLSADLSETRDVAATQAHAIGEKILAELNCHYPIAGGVYHSGASIGVTLFCDHRVTADEVLEQADQAMYRAKADGRNRLCFFDSAVENELLLRSWLEEELRHAVHRDEFVLHYQPEVDSNRNVLGVEALLRWRHPRRGLVLPDEFIATSEQSGLIQSLGRWVLETACAQLASWSADPDMAGLTMSVNISARELRDTHFVQQVLDVVDRSGAPASRLKLELTESMMLDDVDDTIDKMNALKARGVGFSLDDFGTGYASLAYLKRLPLDQLKIDRSFVHDMLKNIRDASIVRSTLHLGQSLGLEVVAEGVETEAERELLLGYGCTMFQGFLFGQPAPVELLRQVRH